MKTLILTILIIFQGCSSIPSRVETFEGSTQSDVLEFKFIKNSSNPGDLSGITWAAPLDSYFLILNRGNLLFEVDSNFNLMREISISGFKDPEDIAFIKINEKGNPEFAIIEERGVIALGEIPNRATKVNRDNFQSIEFANYNSLFHPWNYNKGAEGITYDPEKNSFYIVKEKWPIAILEVSYPNTKKDIKISPKMLVSGDDIKQHVSDLSSVTYDPKKNVLYLLSDESKVILTMNLQSKKITKLMEIDDLEQPEGLVKRNDGSYFVVSEPYYGKTIRN